MTGSVIDRTIGFPLGSVEETEIAFYKTPLGDGLFSYARRENPTVSDCERVLAGIEGAECCLLTSCSMASINIVLSVFNDPADRRPWLFPADVYSGTLQYATEILRGQRGVNVRIAEPAGRNSTTSNLIDAIEDQAPALVFVEPVTNPLLDIVDVPAAAAAHGQGAAVVVDNTFGTPYLFNPLDAGAEIHQRLGVIAGAIWRHQARRQRLDARLGLRQRRPYAKQAGHDALDIGVHRCRRQSEGDGRHGRRRVGADPRKPAQARFGGGKAAAQIVGDETGAFVQIARPGVIAEPLPTMQHVVQRRPGEGFDVHAPPGRHVRRVDDGLDGVHFQVRSPPLRQIDGALALMSLWRMIRRTGDG